MINTLHTVCVLYAPYTEGSSAPDKGWAPQAPDLKPSGASLKLRLGLSYCVGSLFPAKAGKRRLSESRIDREWSVSTVRLSINVSSRWGLSLQESQGQQIAEFNAGPSFSHSRSLRPASFLLLVCHACYTIS